MPILDGPQPCLSQQVLPQAPQAAPMSEDEELAMALAMSAEAAQPPSMPPAPVPSSSEASAPAAPRAAARAQMHSKEEEHEALHPPSAGADAMQPSEEVCSWPSHAQMCTPVDPAVPGSQVLAEQGRSSLC